MPKGSSGAPATGASRFLKAFLSEEFQPEHLQDASRWVVETFQTAVNQFEKWLRKPARCRDLTDKKVRSFLDWYSQRAQTRGAVDRQRRCLFKIWRDAAGKGYVKPPLEDQKFKPRSEDSLTLLLENRFIPELYPDAARDGRRKQFRTAVRHLGRHLDRDPELHDLTEAALVNLAQRLEREGTSPGQVSVVLRELKRLWLYAASKGLVAGPPEDERWKPCSPRSLRPFLQSRFRRNHLQETAPVTDWGYETAVRLYGRFLGRDAALDDLDDTTMEGFLGWYSKRVATPKTVAAIKQRLYRIWRYAAELGLIAPPAEDEKLKRVSNRSLSRFVEEDFFPACLPGKTSSQRQVRSTVRILAGFLGRDPLVDDLLSEKAISAVCEPTGNGRQPSTAAVRRQHLARLRRHAENKGLLPTDAALVVHDPCLRKFFQYHVLPELKARSKKYRESFLTLLNHFDSHLGRSARLDDLTSQGATEFLQSRRKQGASIKTLSMQCSLLGRLWRSALKARKPGGQEQWVREVPDMHRLRATVAGCPKADGQRTLTAPPAGNQGSEAFGRDTRPPARKKRGPKGPRSDARVDRELWEAWKTGSWPTKADLALAKGLPRKEVMDAIDRERKRQERKKPR